MTDTRPLEFHSAVLQQQHARLSQLCLRPISANFVSNFDRNKLLLPVFISPKRVYRVYVSGLTDIEYLTQ